MKTQSNDKEKTAPKLDALKKTIYDLKEPFRKPLIDFLEKTGNQELIKDINEKGMPKAFIVTEEFYEVFNEIFGNHFHVKINRISSEPSILISWLTP